MTPELQDRLFAALERPHRLGMIGGELGDQLAHCASFSRVLGQVVGEEPHGYAVDLGTGGGLPGVALAASYPHLMWTLVEIRTSRATEVERALSRASIENAELRTEPAQDLGHDLGLRERAAVAVARSFGPSSMTAECASGLVAVGGSLIVSEPPQDDEERWPTKALAVLGWSPATIYEDDGHRFAVLRKVAPLREQLPRRSAKPLRRWISG
jgi:16S rRNA (guanine527-N7)-methyltransferase